MLKHFPVVNQRLKAMAPLKTFDPIQPGYGARVRIKVNKFSRAILCIDYGWGPVAQEVLQ
jgi:hypothetical protein